FGLRGGGLLGRVGVRAGRRARCLLAEGRRCDGQRSGENASGKYGPNGFPAHSTTSPIQVLKERMPNVARRRTSARSTRGARNGSVARRCLEGCGQRHPLRHICTSRELPNKRQTQQVMCQAARDKRLWHTPHGISRNSLEVGG